MLFFFSFPFPTRLIYTTLLYYTSLGYLHYLVEGEKLPVPDIDIMTPVRETSGCDFGRGVLYFGSHDLLRLYYSALYGVKRGCRGRYVVLGGFLFLCEEVRMHLY